MPKPFVFIIFLGNMRKIPSGYIVPSSAFTLKKGQIKGYSRIDKKPEPGDVVYGQVKGIGRHSHNIKPFIL